MHSPQKRARRALVTAGSAAALTAAAMLGLPSAAVALPDLPDGPEPTVHSQEAFSPEDDFTAKWTRADARQLQRLSDPATPSRENSMPASLTMPEVPQDFPDMSNEQVWVWDTWPLTDEDGNQYSIKGQEIIFSLVADRSLGFDERHQFAKIGYFYRAAGVPADERPENGGWTYGGLVFDEGGYGMARAELSLFESSQGEELAAIEEAGYQAA